VGLFTLFILVILFFPYILPILQDPIYERIASILSFDDRRIDGRILDVQLNTELLFTQFFGRGLGTSEPWTDQWVESSFFRYTVEIGTASGVVILLISVFTFRYSAYLMRIEEDQEKMKAYVFISALTLFFAIAGIPFPTWFSWYPGILVWCSMAYLVNCYSSAKSCAI
jgi:hypothetical protein